MWNLSSTPPKVIEARVLTRMPDSFREKRRTEWSDANKPGHEVDCFLEGPSFDRDGNLFVVDIPFGRIFRISPTLEWTLVAEYDGWPNGMAFHRDGSLWITDYRRGLLRHSRPRQEHSGAGSVGDPETILGHRNTESFKGMNDLTFDFEGNCYFSDQGQTGLPRSRRGACIDCAPTGSSISSSAASRAPTASRSTRTASSSSSR